jgi:RNA polymerase sigma-70 factor (ECF subfamily)
MGPPAILGQQRGGDTMHAQDPRYGDALALVQRLRSGDRQAFDAFYEAGFDAVFAFAMRRRPEIREAEALTEETLATAIGAIDAYRGDAPLMAWLLAIARRAALWTRCASERGPSIGLGTGSGSFPRADGRHC